MKPLQESLRDEAGCHYVGREPSTVTTMMREAADEIDRLLAELRARELECQQWQQDARDDDKEIDRLQEEVDALIANCRAMISAARLGDALDKQNYGKQGKVTADTALNVLTILGHVTDRYETALADLARVTRVADAGLAGTKEAWAALAMIRETVEAQGVGAMTAGEHLPDPTFTTEAAAIIVGIQKIAEAAESALAVAKAAGTFREGVEAAAKVLSALPMRMRPIDGALSIDFDAADKAIRALHARERDDAGCSAEKG